MENCLDAYTGIESYPPGYFNAYLLEDGSGVRVTVRERADENGRNDVASYVIPTKQALELFRGVVKALEAALA